MKKLKLFTKTYLFTMALMSMIILISHSLIYLALPTVYSSNKQKEVNKISKALVEKLIVSDEETSMKLAQGVAEKYNCQVTLTLDGNTNTFQGESSFDILLDPNVVNDGSLILPDYNDILDSNINNDINEGSSNEDTSNEDTSNGGSSNENTSNVGTINEEKIIEGTVNESAIDKDSINKDLVNEDTMEESSINPFIHINNSSIINSKEFTTSSGVDGLLQIVMNLESFKETRDVIFLILPYSMGISLIISFIASYIYARKITSPIKEICNVTKEMENLNKGVFCRVDTEDEIGMLASNINSLYDNLLNTISSLEDEIENVSKSEQSKVDFLRSASHELKTPLMSMHIMLENMILDIGKYKNHYIYLEKCREVVNNLSNMVQEILDASRLNSIENKNEKVLNLADMVQKTIDPYKLIAKSKGINMKLDINNSFDVKVDEKLFTKALSNIISNAVNYTSEGKEIRIYTKDKNLMIENDCIPIPKEHFEHIFEAFYRADFDRNKSSGGNGLGLYIVQQILSIHKLSYSFKEIPGGMKFTISF